MLCKIVRVIVIGCSYIGELLGQVLLIMLLGKFATWNITTRNASTGIIVNVARAIFSIQN